MIHHENPDIPRELIDKPALELCWRGLAISISAGQMSRKYAMELIEGWEADEERDKHSERYGTELRNLNSES
jgi:hypothetical protein